VARIFRRDLYKFVDEILVPQSMLGHLTKDKVQAADIIAHQDSGDDLTEDDVIVDWLKINYGLQDKNPVDHMKFFSRYNDNGLKFFFLCLLITCPIDIVFLPESHTIPKDKVSIVVPEHFEETSVRIFARDPTKATEIQAAFRRWIRRGPLSKIPNSPITPNPVHTLPENFASPSKHKNGFVPLGTKRKRLEFDHDPHDQDPS